MQRFLDDEQGYRAWLRAHPDGFVVNSYRTPSRDYLILHKATCYTISGTPARGKVWTKDYAKTCSTNRHNLETWARQQVGGSLKPCGHCIR